MFPLPLLPTVPDDLEKMKYVTRHEKAAVNNTNHLVFQSEARSRSAKFLHEGTWIAVFAREQRAYDVIHRMP